MNKFVIAFMIFILVPIKFFAQEESWDVYMASYEKGPGSTVLNMALKNAAPISDYRFVVVTGVTYPKCTNDGFPLPEQFDELYTISDSVQNLINRNSRSIMVGSFTYQCQRKDYFYVSDTIQLREKLNTLYNSRFKAYKPYINIKEDKTWEAYLTFLYPNKETQEYMKNEKVILHLTKAGDKLEKPRQVDHWIYFDTQNHANCFLLWVKANRFKVESNEIVEDGKNKKYKLQISRHDKVDITSISKLTALLKSEAEKCKGDYDGWETFVVKDLP